MNYKKLYDTIITNSINRTKESDVYYERHHIVPKCMKGTDYEDNLVLLTAREHFVVHKLLTKIYPNHKGIKWAYICMCHMKNDIRKRNYSPTSRDYAYARELTPEPWNKGKDSPQCGHHMNIGDKNGMYGSSLSNEHKKKMAEGRRFLYKVNKIIHPNVVMTKERKSIEEIEYIKSTKKSKGYGMIKKRLERERLNPPKPKCPYKQGTIEWKQYISEKTKEGMKKVGYIVK